MKQAMKKSKDASGIMSLNKNLVNDVERQVSKWVDSAKRQGQDIDKMGEEELKYIIELNKPKGPMIGEHRVIDATSPEGKEITESLFGKKGEVVEVDFDKNKNWFKGKSEGVEDVSFKPGMDPKGKIIIESPSQIIARMKAMTPMDAMKEANLVIGRKGKYKNLTIDESQDILKKTNDHIFERDIKYDEFGEIIKPDPEDFAGGGTAGRTSTGLNYLLGEDDQNSRVPYGAGGMGRRLFLKLMGAGAAGTVAAKSGVLGLLKAGKPTAQVLTSVPIKDISGMPAWFKPLVNKVIKEGDDVTKKFATQERQIVHKTKLPDSKTDVVVTQDLTTGDVVVDIGIDKHGFSSGKFGQPVRLEYKAGEVLEGPIKKGKPTKTKEEFWVEEAEFTGGHPENVKFEDSTFNKFGKHESDFSEVEAFAKGKPIKTRKISSLQKEGEDLADHFSNYPTPDDFASGGRVPFFKGKIVKGIMSLGKKKKVNDLGGSKADPFSPDFDMRAEADLIARTPYTPAELKQLIIKKYKGNKLISDDLLNKILADNDPQRLTEVMATIDEALLMQEKGMNPESIVQSFRDAWGRKKNATGGRVSLSGGGLAGMLGE